MVMADRPDPSILILTDGKMGDLAPCRGIARRLTAAERITARVVQPSWFWALPLPFLPAQPADRPGRDGSMFDGPAPDIVLASGRRTIPYCRTWHATREDKRPLIVFLKDPRHSRGIFDLIWIPSHDAVTGANVMTTDTSPHGFDDDALESARVSARIRFADLPAPFTGIILGGNSKSVRWTKEAVVAFCDGLTGLPETGSFLVTASRRTPDILLDGVRQALAGKRHWIWTGEGDNPYAQILGISDTLVVTGDSHNMVSEAVATAARVLVFRPPGLQPKLARFLDRMEELGAIGPLGGAVGETNRPPMDATPAIARRISELWDARR